MGDAGELHNVIDGRAVPAREGRTTAVVDLKSWKRPDVFGWLQKHGSVADDEMLRVFNCGVGFVVIVPRAAADKTMTSLKKSGAKPWMLGEVVKGKQDVRYA